MIGILILTVTALILSVVITLINSKFDKEDKLYKEVLSLLPGYNCGACGYSNCPDMAKHILENPENYKKCRPMKEDNKKEFEMFIKKNFKEG
mgnify:CR=1 FL=1